MSLKSADLKGESNPENDTTTTDTDTLSMMMGTFSKLEEADFVSLEECELHALTSDFVEQEVDGPSEVTAEGRVSRAILKSGRDDREHRRTARTLAPCRRVFPRLHAT